MAAKRTKPVVEEQVLSSWEDFDLLEDSSIAATPDANGDSAKHDKRSLFSKEGVVERLRMLPGSDLPIEAVLEPMTCSALDDIKLGAKTGSKETTGPEVPSETGHDLQQFAEQCYESLSWRSELSVSPTIEELPDLFENKNLQETDATTAEGETLDTSFYGHSSLLALDFDSLCRCLESLTLRDFCTVAQCCKRLREAAFSNPVWRALFR